MSDGTNAGGGGGITVSGGTLFLIFLILKLTDNIDWSWWWVTSPLWIGVALVLSFFVVVVAGAAIVTAITAIVAKVFRR